MTSEQGVVLPIVLLLILALAALSTSALVLARTELVADRSGQRHVTERAIAERVLRTPEGGTEEFRRIATDLSAGLQLIEARPTLPGLSYFALEWVLDPDSVVARLPTALEVGGRPPEEGVEAHEGCVAAGARPLVRRRSSSIGPDGTLREAPPRLGLLGVPELLALPGRNLTSFDPLPDAAEGEILRASGPSFEVRGGDGRGVLVAAGDLVLDTATRFMGVLVVGGNLLMRGSALFEGVAVVGGEVQISEGARLLGCPDFALDALRHPVLARGHPLPGGSFLGRH
jgi:hypothetical protein